MASILKVDTIQDQSGNNIINENADTITIGASGDTINIVGTLQNNGSGLVTGKILQVVNTTNTAQKTTTSTSFTGTSISLSITPSSASSKILILSSSNVFADTTGESTVVTVYRGATNLGHSVAGMGRFQNGASNLYSNWSVSVFDSPSTTSATTYEIYFRATGGGAIAYVSNGTSPTFLTALEIGA